MNHAGPRHALTTACLGLLGLIGFATPRAQAEPAVFVEHRFHDPGMGNTLAFTILAPEGWTQEGELTRLPVQVFQVPLAMDVTFTAPDGRQARILPSLSFQFGPPHTNDQFQRLSPTREGYLFYPLLESPGAFVADAAQHFPKPGVTGFRVLREATIPELTQQLRQQNAAMFQMVQQLNAQYQQLAAQGMQMGINMQRQTQFDTQASTVEVTYREDGRAYHESILILWTASVNYVNGQIEGGHWSIRDMRSARAPLPADADPEAATADYLNDPQIMAIFRSLTANPAWTAEMQRHWQRMAQIQRRGQQQRQADWQRHNAKMQQLRNETSAIIHDGWASRQAIQERSADNFNDAIRDETAYLRPDGTTVKLPSFYDTAYTNGDGKYILSNDANFSPVNHPDFTGNWTPLQPRQ